MRDSPPPATVAGNRWPDLAVPAPGAWTPERRVGVVVVARRGDDLDDLVPALGRQSYPGALLDVVVVAAGANVPRSGLGGVRVVAPSPGVGAHQTAVEASDGDIVCFLAPGAAVEPTTVEAHARWHHAACDVVTLGWLNGPGWLDRYRERTADLALPGPDHFRAADLRGLAVSRTLLDLVGGVRDLGDVATSSLELGWRLSTAGAVFVPEPLPARPQDAGDDGRRPRPRCPRLVPADRRPLAPLPAGAVPAVVARVPADGASPDAVAATVHALLASDAPGGSVRVETGGSATPAAADRPGALDDPRVTVGPPAPWWSPSPVQVWVPPAVVCSAPTLRLLAEELADGTAGALSVTVPGLAPAEGTVLAVTTAALCRAGRLTGTVGGGRPDEAATDVLTRLAGWRWIGGERIGFARWSPDRPVILADPSASQRVEADVARRLVRRLDETDARLGAARERVDKLEGDRRALRVRLRSTREQVEARDRRIARTRSQLDEMRARVSAAERQAAALRRRRAVRVADALAEVARARSPRRLAAALRSLAGALVRR